MKRNRSPPPRLKWPTPGPLSNHVQVGRNEDEHFLNNKYRNLSYGAKRKKISEDRSKSFHKIGSQYNENDDRIWTEKYSCNDDNNNITVRDLCVNSRKVGEVRNWMESAIHGCTRLQSDYSKFLLLVGSPGVGKSTMCRALAKELKLNLLEWNNLAQNNAFATNNPYPFENSIFSNSYQSQINSFEEFLHGAGAGCNSLNIEKVSNMTANVKKGAILLLEEVRVSIADLC